MLSTTASYNLINRDLEQALRVKSSEPQIERERAYYLERITQIKSVDEFLDDDRVYRFAMTAHGMSDMIYAKAFMRKALEEGIDEPESFANSLADQRYATFVATFNFARYGDAATAFDRTQEGTADLYVRQNLETDAGADNEGVRLALYFQRKAPEITSAYNILADRALLQVAQTALGLPTQMSFQDIDRQAELINDRLDIEDLQDPEKLNDFLDRFTAIWDINQPRSAAQTGTVPNVVIGQPISFGLSTSLLTQLQGLKLGGS